MSRTALAAIALIVPFACACAVVPQKEAAAPVVETIAQLDPKVGGFEPVFAAASDREAVTFRVNSNGCTTKQDFAVDVRREGTDATVTLRRLRPDACRHVKPQNVDVKFAFQELGLQHGDAIRFGNPFAGS